MKYTEQEQLEEILHRGAKLRHRKDKNLFRGLSATSAILLFTVTALIVRLGETGSLERKNAYGSFLLSAETGGYVLTAVLAFVIGVLTTVIIKKRRKYNSFVTNTDYATQVKGKEKSGKG